MSYSGGWRPRIESALRLSVAQFCAVGALVPGRETSGGWQWKCDGKAFASIGYRAKLDESSGTLALAYSVGRDGERRSIECKIPLVTVPCTYGGRRWYAVCPYTGRRALMLYKWEPVDLFCHRDAIRPRPTYAIQRVSGFDRVITQRWALRRKMGDTLSDLTGEPIKPKWMRWRTYERYAARDAELEAQDACYMAGALARMGVPGWT